MLILTSPDATRIVVYNKRHDQPEDAYSATENITGYPTQVRDLIAAEHVTTALFMLAGKGWTTRFEPDKGQPKPRSATSTPAGSAPHLPAMGATSEFLSPTKG